MLSATPRAQAPFVQEHPFVAEFRCLIGSSSGSQITGRLFRDRQGRIRIDYKEGNEEIRIIDETAEMKVAFLDMRNRFVQRDSYGVLPTAWSFRAAPTYTTDYQELKGIECRRITFGSPEPGALEKGALGETWIAESNGIVMRDENPLDGWMWEITAIDLREPSLDAFAIPEGFVEVEE